MKHGKRIFKIEGRNDMPQFIMFILNSTTRRYGGGGGSGSFIYCAKSSPFNT